MTLPVQPLTESVAVWPAQTVALVTVSGIGGAVEQLMGAVWVLLLMPHTLALLTTLTVFTNPSEIRPDSV